MSKMDDTINPDDKTLYERLEPGELEGNAGKKRFTRTIKVPLRELDNCRGIDGSDDDLLERLGTDIIDDLLERLGISNAEGRIVGCEGEDMILLEVTSNEEHFK